MHQRRTAQTAILAVILSTLLLPAVGSLAGSEERRAEKERQLESVRGRIAETEADEAGVRAEVDALNADILALRRDVAGLDQDIARVESEVRSAQARIDATRAKMDKIKDRAVDQAVSLYKAGSTDVLNTLLNSESLTELDARAEMLGVAAQENTDSLIQYGRLNLQVQAQYRELFNTKQELAERRKRRARVLATLDEKHTELAANLRKLQQELGRQYAMEGNLEDDVAALTRKILAAQAGYDVAVRGVSGQGYIWPLNGAITSYYGPRWGRMHTGIDIDGTTGQPVVASKAGRVILASYYSGYGNAVIIDHGGGYATLYGHLSGFNASSGASVPQGQVIGYVGCTGSCTGDHLHFEVRVNGSPVDPLDYLP